MRVAEEHRLVLFSDEIYDRILYDGAEHVPVATLCEDTLCATFGGLSKVYRACGLRTGWVFFSGKKDHAAEYLDALELLASLRLCANVPGQWAVQTALGGVQSIYELTAPDGPPRPPAPRARARRGALAATSTAGHAARARSTRSSASNRASCPASTTREFAMALLETKHVLVVPGSSFNVDYTNHFRLTFLPDEETLLSSALHRIEATLAEWKK